MTQRSVLERNVCLYAWYRIFCEPLFWGPIVVLALQKLGKMTLPEIYYMESIAVMLLLVLDIPLGALADVIGRKKVLFMGQIFLAASMIGFATMDSKTDAWIANFIWAIGIALSSGANSALFYDTLKELGREAEHKRLEGRYQGFRLLLMSICCLFVGLLAQINLRLPLYLSIPTTFIPIIVTFFLKEPIHIESASIKKHFGVMKNSIVFSLSCPPLRWMIGFSTLIIVASKLWFFTYNPYFEKVGIDLKYYGVIFFMNNIVAWLSSHYMYKIEEKFGEKKCIILMISCIGFPMIFMGSFPFWPFAYFVLFQNVVRGFVDIFIRDFVNHHIIDSRIRSTVLSVRSSCTSFVAIIAMTIYGGVMTKLGLLLSLIIVGIGVLVLGAYLSKRYNVLFKNLKPQL